MKIAHIHWGFPPIIGGVETHLVFLMPEQVKMGHTVSLLTCSAEGHKAKENYKGCNVFRSQFMDLNWLFKSGFQEVDDRVPEVFEDFLDATKPDVIHAHNMHYFCRYHTRILETMAQKRKIPMVLTAHNTWADKLFLDLTLKISWDRIISISHYIKRELVGVGFPKDKIITIHHGMDDKMFAPGKVDPKIFKKHPVLKGKKKIIFHPARMGMAKGCDITIQAFKMVKDEIKDAFLLMSGSGNIIDWGGSQNKDIAYFMSLIKQLGLEKDVYTNTFDIAREMPNLYRLADVIVYPSSVEEPFGLTMLEAMSTAKPIIVTNCGGMPEIIQNDVNGYVVQRRNAEALAEKMILLLKDKKLNSCLGNTGRRLIKEKYTKAIYAKSVTDTYRDVIREYSPKKPKKGLSRLQQTFASAPAAKSV
ncbi:MAG: glycosyltransferase family 4 protein [Candidatus Saganbacteria bacterium]|nr:glycosyltransferase family 4 protein [Candidatus Saganbacteria bacterium]